MHRLLKYVSAAALAVLSFGLDHAVAGHGSDCRQKSLEHLRASSPDGFAIFQQISDKDFFKSWINCDDAQFDLSTAVHESTHFITSETDAFPLVGGGAIRRPHEVSQFFPPSRIANKFKADDLTATYLRPGKASSSGDFLYLLDEFNAYSHDLNAAVDLKGLTRPDEGADHRDGLAGMMAFVAVYAETAKAGDAETWRGLQHPKVARTISALWGRAERVMASSCGIPNFGTEYKRYIRQSCAAGPRTALGEILGRAPVCPTACLSPTLDDEPSSETVEVASAPDDTLPKPPRHTSAAGPPSLSRAWINQVIRSLPGTRDTAAVDASTTDDRADYER